jgi:hypothetical protein
MRQLQSRPLDNESCMLPPRSSVIHRESPRSSALSSTLVQQVSPGTAFDIDDPMIGDGGPGARSGGLARRPISTFAGGPDDGGKPADLAVPQVKRSTRWIFCRPRFLLPVRVLSCLFRRLFLKYCNRSSTPASCGYASIY